MKCAECGIRRIPARKKGRQGRPRKHCFFCCPPTRGSVYDTPKLRREIEIHRAVKRAIDKMIDKLDRHNNRLHEPIEQLRAAEDDYWAKNGRCGCGRDYATVPLGEAHLCTNPIRDPYGPPAF